MVPKDMYISEKTDDWQELIRDNGFPATGDELSDVCSTNVTPQGMNAMTTYLCLHSKQR
jgi:hypothetical protein